MTDLPDALRAVPTSGPWQLSLARGAAWLAALCSGVSSLGLVLRPDPWWTVATTSACVAVMSAGAARGLGRRDRRSWVTLQGMAIYGAAMLTAYVLALLHHARGLPDASGVQLAGLPGALAATAAWSIVVVATLVCLVSRGWRSALRDGGER